MRRLLRTASVWALAAAAAGGWWTLRGTTSDGRGSAAPTQLFSGSNAIAPEAIDRITLARRDEPPRVFERVDGRWRQVEPFAADLDEWSARQLAVEASTIASARFLDDRNAAELGFLPPAATLTLEATSGASSGTQTLEFGRRGVAGRAFVRRAGGPIAVVDATLHERAVEMDPKEWRSRFLFPDSLGRPTRLVWTLGDGVIELHREGERWLLTSPVATRADKDRVDELLAGIVRSRSEGFLVDQPGDLATFGLMEPAATLAFSASGERGEGTRTLVIGAPLGVGTADRFAMIDGAPTVLRLGAGTQGVLFPRVEALIDPIATAIRPADVKRIEIRRKGDPAGEQVELTRELDRWTMSTGSAATACAPERVERLLAALAREPASEIALGGFPADLEIATILLFGFDSRPLDAVRVARDPKSGRIGLENGDGVLRVHGAGFSIPLSAGEFGG